MTGKQVKAAALSIAVIAFVVVAQPARAQAPPISAEVDRNSISTDDTLTLTVVIQATGGTPLPSLPFLDDFNVLSRSTAAQISIVNQKVSGEVTFTYVLQPTRSGSFDLGPISAMIAGKTYTTSPIRVELTAGSGPAAAPRPAPSSRPPAPASASLAGQDLFAEAEVDNPTPYLGQQVTYIFRYYRAVRPTRSPRYDAPDFTGFWSKQETEQSQHDTRAAGRLYRVVELRSIIFPTVAGPAEIKEATLTVPGGLFAQSRELRTEPLAVDVRPLPDGAPASFSGAVGRFDIDAEIDGSSGRVNEPFTLTVTISGEGNFDTLPEPAWPELANWRAFDSSATTNSEVRDGKLAGRRVYERLLVPGAQGEFTIPPIEFTYFDPGAGEYRMATTDPVPVTVALGAAEAPLVALPGSAKEGVERLATDIRHIKPVPPVLSPGGSPLTERGGYWVAWVVPLVALGAAVAWQRRQERLEGNTALARSSRARRKAGALLAQAKRDGSDPHIAAGQALTTYMSDRLNEPVAGMTHDALGDLLASRSIGPELIDRVRNAMVVSEGGRFAPSIGPSGHNDDLLAVAEQLIVELEQELGI